MADAKVTALTALSGAMTLDDLLLAVNDPAGTPASRKATAAQVLGLDQAYIRGLIVTKNSGANTLDISAGYCFDPSSGKVIYYAGSVPDARRASGTVYIYDNAGTSHDWVTTTQRRLDLWDGEAGRNRQQPTLDRLIPDHCGKRNLRPGCERARGESA
jgi:hypothetical protein